MSSRINCGIPDQVRDDKRKKTMSMSLNKVMLIGHLTADPELRYTPQGTAVATFSVATNRVWNDNSGQRQESSEFTRCVAWTKLAEICQQMLSKGKRVFVEGRLQTRDWEGKDGIKRKSTEVVLENMIALSSRDGSPSDTGGSSAVSAPPVKKKKSVKEEEDIKIAPAEEVDQEVAAEDIPF